jgi:hypothetical protein
MVLARMQLLARATRILGELGAAIKAGDWCPLM